MAAALFRQVKVDIRADGGIFRANGTKVVFDGFMKVFKGNGSEKQKMLPLLKEGEVLVPESVDKEVHFTEPPPRFTDATLVRFLEESGINQESADRQHTPP
jgi:DNA topoisomerase-1